MWIITLFPQGWEAQSSWVTYKTEELGFKPRYISLWSSCSSHVTELLAGKQWYISFLSMRDSCGSVNSLIGLCFCQKVSKDRNNNLIDQLNYVKGIRCFSFTSIQKYLRLHLEHKYTIFLHRLFIYFNLYL